MKKRRRAYKKYKWRLHSMYLIDEQLRMSVETSYKKYIELAILYGVGKIEHRKETVTLKAGLWKFEIDINVPHLKGAK